MNEHQRNTTSVRCLIAGVVCLLGLSACSYLPGTEEATPEFSHDFRATDSEGKPVDSSSLVFAWDGLNGYWQPLDESGDLEVFAGSRLIPKFTIDTEELELDSFRRLCLAEPIVFMMLDSVEVVHEVPVGTCLEDDGRTEFVVSK